MPLQRRLPKRGFNNIFRKEIVTVNVSDLETRFNDGDTVDAAALIAAGLIKKEKDGVKVLGGGELTKKLDVKVQLYSEAAKTKIEAAGGKAEVV